MSDLVNMTIYAATYKDLDAAELDCDLVKEIYHRLAPLDSFDAAILQKNQKGKVKIAGIHEQSNHDGDPPSAGRGLAIGLAVALFPTAAIGAGLLPMTAGTGAAVSAIARCAVSGMCKQDLKELGEILDDGDAGLIVIAAADLDGWMEAALDDAETVIKKEIKADQKAIEEDIGPVFADRQRDVG